MTVSGEATGGVMIASSILSGRALALIESAIANWRGLLGARQSYDRLGKLLSGLAAEQHKNAASTASIHANAGFEAWATAQGLNGIAAKLWFWTAIASAFLVLLIWALRNLRLERLAGGAERRNAPAEVAQTRPTTAALPPAEDDIDIPDSLRGYLTFGTALALLLLGGGGAWAALTDIAGAVLASGTVVVDSKVKKVQHPTGGIVGDILVKDDDAVKSGDLLLRLDDTATRANLQAITKQAAWFRRPAESDRPAGNSSVAPEQHKSAISIGGIIRRSDSGLEHKGGE